MDTQCLPTDQPAVPKRPNRHDSDVCLEAARKSVPALRQWLGSTSSQYTDEALAADLAKAARRHDGYDRAREMERLGYDPDTELVELLDGLDTWGACEKAMAAWVEAHGIKPVFQVGARVVWKREMKPGTIVAIDEKHGRYTVLLDEDKPKREKGHIGHIFDYERVEAEILWCVNVKGPDDVLPVHDRAHADRLAKAINDQLKPEADKHDILFEAVVIVWPWSHEAHASGLASPSVDYAGAITATLPPALAIQAERKRQIEVEGWEAHHDDVHDDGSLLRAAVLYLHHATKGPGITYEANGIPTGWPWAPAWWKPKDPRRDLVRAGALCVAERERLQRAGQRYHHVDHKYDLIVAALNVVDAASVGEG